MNREEIAKWLGFGLERSGISMAAASRELGLPKDAISKVLRQERELTATELTKLTKLLGIAPPRALAETMQPALYILVVGDAQVGLWRDVSQSDFTQYFIPATVDPSFDREDVYAILIGGDSINKKARDGDHVIALKYDRAPREMRAGDWVVVERTVNSLRERTIKILKDGPNGRLEAWPYSTDKRYQSPLIIGVHENETVEVVAFVIHFVSSGTKF